MLSGLGRIGRASAIGFISLLVALLAACGGGGGSGGSAGGAPTATTGSVTVGVTDAAGDFLSYTVDVLRVELHKKDGSIVQALPAKTRIDFATLSNLTELLSVASVPPGEYDQVNLVLDYSNASIVVQDANGAALDAVAKDANGAAIGELTVGLKLPDTDHITVSAGSEHAFTVDFNLAASNSVSFATSPPVVTVTPFLEETNTLNTDREGRLRGLLSAVDQTAKTVSLTVRPHGNEDGRFGTATFGVDANTAYNVNGTRYTGNDGLVALAGLATDSMVVAQGMIVNKQLKATRVEAGTSLPSSTLSAVHGVVVSRHGNLLEVRGAVNDHGGEGDFESHTVHVTLDSTTNVVNEFDNSASTTDAISIGSLISAYGTLDKSGDSPVLTTAGGRVALHLNEVAGAVVSTGPLTVDLAYINGFRPASFNFAGTGAGTDSDANPHAYIVDTTGLDLGSLAVGDVIRVRGMVAGFGLAHPDFKATTLIDVKHETKGAEVTVTWQPPTTTPFSAATASGITLNLTGAHSELHLADVKQNNTSDVVTTLVPNSDGTGMFGIALKGTEGLTLYKTFGEFVDALNTQLNGKVALRLSASGQFNATNGTLTVTRLGVQIGPLPQ